MLKEGFAKWTARFNARGNQVEQTYFGIDGQPALGPNALAGWASKFDVRGNRVETTYFGIDGQPALRKEGYARIVSDYDEKNLPTKTLYFDAAGKPVTGRVVVVSVRAGSQGQRLGLRPDDVLAAYEGEPITDWTSFIYRRRAERNRGRSPELRIVRGDATLKLKLSPGILGATLKDDCLPASKSVAAAATKPPPKPQPLKPPPLRQAAAVGPERH